MGRVTARTVNEPEPFNQLPEEARDAAQWESICQLCSHPSFYLQRCEKQTKNFLSQVTTDRVPEPTSGKPLRLGAGSLPNHPKRAESPDFIRSPKYQTSGATVFDMESLYNEHIYLEFLGSSNSPV